MKTIKGAKTYEEEILSGFVAKASEPEWLVKKRAAAFEHFKALGLPTRKQEAWKYIYLEGLLNRSFEKSMSSPHVLSGDPQLIDSRFRGNDSGAEDYLAREWTPETNPFVHLNTFQFQECSLIRIPKDTAAREPLQLIFEPQGNHEKPPVFYPRVLIVAEAGSTCEVVFQYRGRNPEAYFMNSVIEFVLAPKARVSCSLYQDQKPQAVEFLNVRARLEKGSHLEIAGVVTGGSITRNDLHVDLDGAGAVCSLAGLSVLDGRSQAFHHVSVNHRFLGCTSRQTYKNILSGESVAEYNSLVHVWRCAQDSDAAQLDKNLLPSDGARVYSRPQLKIDNDSVRASHGAATGRLEKEELFYLQSRGIPKNAARFLLIYGFAKEVLEKVKPEGLRKELESRVENEIRSMVGSGS